MKLRFDRILQRFRVSVQKTRLFGLNDPPNLWIVLLVLGCGLSGTFGGILEAQAQEAKGKVPVIDRNRLEGAGFILSAELSPGKKIFASQEATETLGKGDMVYINMGKHDEVPPGAKFTIYRPSKTVIHPITGEALGYLIAVNGVLEVVEVQEMISSALITKNYNSPIFKGDRIALFEEMPIPQVDPSQTPPSKEIQGYIVAAKDDKEYVGQSDIVYLDRGRRDGVASGDFFLIYQQGRVLEEVEWEDFLTHDTRHSTGRSKQAKLPQVPVGELVIIATEEKTSTAFISRSSAEIWAGNPVSYSKSSSQ